MRSICLAMVSYPLLPEPDETYSAWVTPKAAWYDPKVTNMTYDKYLSELEYADALGFDGIALAEHHNSAYMMTPSPNLFAAALARRTQNAAIGVLGNTLAAYSPPTRVAEELAMLDALSGGRVIAGFVLGTSMDTAYCQGLNPSQVRERFNEAHDIITRAWTSDEPFAFNGRYNQLRYVNPWPRVAQDPHPPIWCPAGGSPETWEFTARNNYLYAYLSFGGLKAADKLNDGYWETIKQYGREPNPFSLAATQMIFVADSYEEAKEVYGPAVNYFFGRVMKFDPGFAGAPGYLSERAIREAVKSSMVEAAKGQALTLDQGGTFDAMVESGFITAGSPEQVTEGLIEKCTKYRLGNLVQFFSVGNMSQELSMQNMRMYAEHVMPNVCGLFEDEWEHEWWPKAIPERVPLRKLWAKSDDTSEADR